VVCGLGYWLNAAAEAGVDSVFGVDGLDGISETHPRLKENFMRADLTTPLVMDRHFDTAICLEVAEHLPESAAPVLIESLASHADRILFSAACPGQMGQSHHNCQWPSYWQELFNRHGFCCSDSIRFRIWENPRVEPWYRQNMFIASRNPGTAGSEKRILPILHPDMVSFIQMEKDQFRIDLENGRFSARKCAQYLMKSVKHKFISFLK